MYEVIFIPECVERPGKEIIHRTELSVYIQDFGKETDMCLVTETDGNLAGTVCARVFSANGKVFGYVDVQAPEMSKSGKKES